VQAAWQGIVSLPGDRAGDVTGTVLKVAGES
jgi:hypothetical protein